MDITYGNIFLSSRYFIIFSLVLDVICVIRKQALFALHERIFCFALVVG